MFMPGDKVKYIGRSLFSDLGSKTGEVISKVSGEENAFVVEFGDDAFLVSGASLSRSYVAPGLDTGYTPRRRRDPDLDDE